MRRKANFVLQSIGSEHLLVPIGPQVLNMNGLIVLNETGSCIWELLAQDLSLRELALVVAERFDVDPERAVIDVQKFLEEIAQMGLVE